MSQAALRGIELRRHFGAFEAVAGLSLSVDPGEMVALLGPSGCGKTTVLQMLGLLDRPDGGRVLVGEADGFGLPSRERARLRLCAIGFVFQQHGLLEYLTARENVALPAWRLRGRRAEALAAADEALERFGLYHRRTAPAKTLSPGEAQRVAVARALVNSPRVLLADEPTGALDSRSAEPVLGALERACAAGAAVLLVTHDRAVAARASRRLYMADGRTLEPAGGGG